MVHRRVNATILSVALWFTVRWMCYAQNTNQVLGEVRFEGKTKIDKSSGVWVDG
jgi:hypothetical protein